MAQPSRSTPASGGERPRARRPRRAGGPGRDPVGPRALTPSRTQRVLRRLSTLLIVLGALGLADAAATVAWQEPLTALRASAAQASLDDELAALEAGGPTLADARAARDARGRRERVAALAGALQARAAQGQAVARLEVPRLGLRTVVVHGSTPEALRTGPGLYDGQPYPGAGGTAAIAGHRTTFGAPFAELDRLRRGDRITVTLPYARVVYEVERLRVVEPSEVGVLRRRPGAPRLLLTACHPRFSAAQRLVAEARLVEQVARGAGAAGRQG